MTASLPPQAFAAALAGFERMSLHRLATLLRHHSPELAYEVASGRELAPGGSVIRRVLDHDAALGHAWRAAATRHSPEVVWERCLRLGVNVSIIGDAEHPAACVLDPVASPVLFSQGDRSLLEGRRVAMVGTRNATASGRHVARTLGRDLADADVHVVSGLARGIDGHAHLGVFDTVDAGSGAGRPVAVVASGHDVVYPREHRALWHRVAAEGLLLSEYPPGAVPAAYRFPMRNRLVAALSELVVVVESRERGGSLITANAAAERGVPVMAVPGNITSRAALGVNELLRDGAAPVLDAGDILIALQLDHTRSRAPSPDRRHPLQLADVGVHDAVVVGPCTIGEIARRCSSPLLEVAVSLGRLERDGWVAQVDGWFEALGSPPA